MVVGELMMSLRSKHHRAPLSVSVDTIPNPAPTHTAGTLPFPLPSHQHRLRVVAVAATIISRPMVCVQGARLE